MEQKTRQRLYQFGFAILVICLILVLERGVQEPSGVYSYTSQGYKGFEIGMTRAAVLKEVNRVKSIRSIMTCGPERVFPLTSRRNFDLAPALAQSWIWICQDKKNRAFVFRFKGNRLEQVLRVNRGKEPPLFDQCPPGQGLYTDLDRYLRTQTRFRVFYPEV